VYITFLEKGGLASIECAAKYIASLPYVDSKKLGMLGISADTSILNTAIKAMQYDIEHYTGDPAWAIDTYDNLLYKSGRIKEAIKWKTKAVQLSNNGNEYIDTLEKMNREEPIWSFKCEICWLKL
jgi:hypothetical protein